jgi:hypothetical protein
MKNVYIWNAKECACFDLIPVTTVTIGQFHLFRRGVINLLSPYSLIDFFSFPEISAAASIIVFQWTCL